MMNLVASMVLAFAMISVPEDVEARRFSLASVEETLETTGRALLVRRKSATRICLCSPPAC